MQLARQNVAEMLPLVVDLDGSLIRTDMLYESFFSGFGNGVGHHLQTFRALLKGKAALKAWLAGHSQIDYTLLPYNDAVVDVINQAKSEGRPIYLATASDRRHAAGIAEHLGGFDGIFASDGEVNLSGQQKAAKLVQEFGCDGFDYVGNGAVDIAVWQAARQAYVVGASGGLLRKIDAAGLSAKNLADPDRSIMPWIKALRLHQYAKNLLIFVPMLTAHLYTLDAIRSSVLTFIAFSLCASSVYIVNDLLDIDSDRRHPSKKRRPFASGTLPIAHGIIASPLLLLASAAIALSISVQTALVLGAYFILTLAYSIKLKRKMMLDVVVLAILYTTRVIAGAVAVNVAVSEWLLIFCIMMFTCLALVKRYVELALRIDQDLPDPSNRNYKLSDLPVVGALAAAAGFNTVTIFALYVSSLPASGLYRDPKLLWLACPILVFWIGRLLLLAQRRIVDDDPIVFALRDSISHLAAACMIAIVFLAT
ncbi:MAG: UbiA family prenyltransferase [Afipia sp.]